MKKIRQLTVKSHKKLYCKMSRKKMGGRWRNIWIQSFFSLKKKEDMKVCLSNNRNDQEERKNIILQKGNCGVNWRIEFLRMEGK